MICVQARVPEVSVSQVARRYDVNANLVFKWLRDPHYASEESSDEPARFLPVEIIEERGRQPPATGTESRIEIALASGHTLRITGTYDAEALARLIRSLSA